MFDFEEKESATDERFIQYRDLMEKMSDAKKEIVLMYYDYIRMTMEDEFEGQLTTLKKQFKKNPENVIQELEGLKTICEKYDLRDIRSTLERALTLSYGRI